MAFDVAADYDRFMGRFAVPLARRTVGALGPRPGQRALDVGCGSGALTAELVGVLGAPAVAAVDPAPEPVAAVARRLPGVDARVAAAEFLPHDDETFDLSVAQLAVHFMADPVGGLREMRRVTRPGGRVAASVWDFGGQRSPLTTFWTAVRSLDPAARGEPGRSGRVQGELADLFRGAGLLPDLDDELTVEVGYDSFDAWWESYTLGVGPAGDYVARLGPSARETLRRRCAELLPRAAFTVEATAWFVAAPR
ncbi:class I SAM-dependent methyltransferase [Kineococcus sp. GCM10028916]|uniref:class I SAM-dependent methyltransferase n=1 Tax=Kineococcus sp. GCM10028916 TaxID=3273394 RepID=UPI0036397A79